MGIRSKRRKVEGKTLLVHFLSHKFPDQLKFPLFIKEHFRLEILIGHMYRIGLECLIGLKNTFFDLFAYLIIYRHFDSRKLESFHFKGR